MKLFYGLLSLLTVFMVISCSDSKIVPGSDPLKGAKPGWNSENVERLIACQPTPSEVCDCVVPKITSKYTPEQIEAKSPYVAADMLEIKNSCGGGSKPQTSDKPVSVEPPPNPIGPTQYPSLTGENCETGGHQFSSFTALCEGLESDSLNNKCALTERQAIFKELKCPGKFEQKP